MVHQAKEHRVDSLMSISRKAKSPWTPVPSRMFSSRTEMNHRVCNRATATSFHSCPSTQTPGREPPIPPRGDPETHPSSWGLLLLERRAQKVNDAKITNLSWTRQRIHLEVFSKQLLQSIRRYLCPADPPTVHCAWAGDCEGLGVGAHMGDLGLRSHSTPDLSFWFLSTLLSPSHNQRRTKHPCPQDIPTPTQSAPEHTQLGAGNFSPLSSPASPLG